MNTDNKNKCPQELCDKDHIVAFRTTVIKSIFGDDATGSMKPANGIYFNMIVKYEANGAVYIYDSDGIYTNLKEGA